MNAKAWGQPNPAVTATVMRTAAGASLSRIRPLACPQNVKAGRVAPERSSPERRGPT